MSGEAGWRRRGFFGPWAVAVAAKQGFETDARVGAMVPVAGEPPIVVDPATQTTGMFGIWDRASGAVPVPEGMYEADPDLVGRFISA
jgi:hypothetical protein